MSNFSSSGSHIGSPMTLQQAKGALSMDSKLVYSLIGKILIEWKGAKFIINKLWINETYDWASNQGSVPHYSVDPEGYQIVTQWSYVLIWKWGLTFSAS